MRENTCKCVRTSRLPFQGQENPGKCDKRRKQHTKSVASLEGAAGEGKEYGYNHLPDDVETLKVTVWINPSVRLWTS